MATLSPDPTHSIVPLGNPGQPAEQKLSRKEVRILHLSDIHFGLRIISKKWQTNWQNALAIAKKVTPDLIIISGDFVDSPFRWSLAGARRKVDELRREVGIVPVLLTPGNHDVRVLGILPIDWIYPLLGLVLLLSAAVRWSQWLPRVADFFIVAAILLAILRLAFVARFDQVLTKAPLYSRFEDLGLEVFCFDSARSGPFFAQGKILAEELSNASKRADEVTQPVAKEPGETAKTEAIKEVQAAPQIAEAIPVAASTAEASEAASKTLPRLMRLAILHHHALPIPYEQDAEPMMVLRNAGAFLRQASKLGISLILHGHRHRFSFARVTVDAHTRTPFEVAVLATGSPTAATVEDHNINLIKLNRWGAAEITPYWSHKESPFEKAPVFWARSIVDSARDAFRINAQRQGCFCKRMIVTVDINEDGDAHRTVEYRGFQPIAESACSKLPGQIKAELGVGHLERPHLEPPTGPPGFSLKLEEGPVTLRTYEAKISFSRELKAGEVVDFFWHYHAIGSYAMSQQQFEQMSDPGQTEPAKEWARATVKHVPAEELAMIIKLPRTFSISSREVRLFVGDRDGQIEPELQRELESSLRYDSFLNLITFRVPYPPLDMQYKVEWSLPVQPPPTSLPIHLIGKALALVESMHVHSNPSGSESPLNLYSERILDLAQNEFELPPEDRRSLEFSLMAYDEKSRNLRVVAGSYPKGDPRWDQRMPYGDGIAGRAYKANFPRVFVKRLALVNKTPFYYLPTEDKPLSDDGREIAEEVIVAMPIRYTEMAQSGQKDIRLPENKENIIAVLNLSSRDKGSRLVDLTAETVTIKEDFLNAVGDMCRRILVQPR